MGRRRSFLKMSSQFFFFFHFAQISEQNRIYVPVISEGRPHTSLTPVGDIKN